MAINFAPFGTYTNVVGVITAATKAEITALLDTFEAFYIAPTGSPDFDRIPLDVQEKLTAELAGVRTAIAAAPVV